MQLVFSINTPQYYFCDEAHRSETVGSPLSSSDDTHRVTSDSSTSRERERRVIVQHSVEEVYTRDEHKDGSTSSKWQRRHGGTDSTVTGVCDVSVCGWRIRGASLRSVVQQCTLHLPLIFHRCPSHC